MAEKVILFLCIFLWSAAEFVIVYIMERKIFGTRAKRPTPKSLIPLSLYVMIAAVFALFGAVEFNLGTFLLTILFYVKSYLVLNEILFIEHKFETVLDIVLVQTIIGIGGQTIFYYLSGRQVIKLFEIRREYCHSFFALIAMFFFVALFAGRQSRAVNYYRVVSKLLYVCIILIFLTLGIMEVVLCEGELSSKINSAMLRILWFIVLTIMIVITAKLFAFNRDKILTGTVMEMLKEQNESLVDYYEEIGKKEKKLHAFKHDMDNMMLGLSAMAEKGDGAGVAEYIGEITKRTESITEKYETGNYVANAILNIKAKQLEDDGNWLEFRGNMPKTGIKNMDMCILLSNALDNSIEACRRLNKSCTVSIESETKNNLWKIEIKNPCAEKLEVINNHVNTTKKNKLLHGYGLKNIEEVVERHFGTMRVTAEAGIFRINILLELRNK